MKKQKIILSFTFLIVFFIFSFLAFKSPARADELEDIVKQINKLQESLQMSQAATTPLIKTLENLDMQIASIRSNIAQLEKELDIKREEVADGEKAFALKQQVMENRIRSMYKNTYTQECFWCQLVSAETIQDLIQTFGYHQSLVNDDK
jgi:peptidoglycan hydrolase CwlO-like protein